MSASTSRPATSGDSPLWLDYIVYSGGFFLAVVSSLLIGGLFGSSLAMFAQANMHDYSTPVIVAAVIGFGLGAALPVVTCALVTRNGHPVRIAFAVGVIPVLVGLAGSVGWFATGRDHGITAGWLVGPLSGLLVALMPAAIWMIMQAKAAHWAAMEKAGQGEQDAVEG